MTPQDSGSRGKRRSPSRSTSSRQERKETSDRKALVKKALALIEKRIEQEEIGSSLSDLIRLLELADAPGSDVVKAFWVESEE